MKLQEETQVLKSSSLSSPNDGIPKSSVSIPQSSNPSAVVISSQLRQPSGSSPVHVSTAAYSTTTIVETDDDLVESSDEGQDEVEEVSEGKMITTSQHLDSSPPITKHQESKKDGDKKSVEQEDMLVDGEEYILQTFNIDWVPDLIIEAKDRTGKWIPAMVIEVKNELGSKMVHIAYFNWKSEYNEWMDTDKDSGRLRPLGSGLKESEVERERREEEEQFREALSKKGFSVVDTDKDGNCLFSAWAHQVFGDVSKHTYVRAECYKHMIKHKDFFKTYVIGDFDAYVHKNSEPGEWGDHVEIIALR